MNGDYDLLLDEWLTAELDLRFFSAKMGDKSALETRQILETRAINLRRKLGRLLWDLGT
jgi:hypothetical protein